MCKSFSFCKSFLKTVLIFLCYVLFASCSQNLPEVKQANGTIVFEYENEDSFPNARMTVFVESVSDPRRYDTIKVQSYNQDFEWETEEISMIQGTKKKYAGYTNFVMPEGEKFPAGRYNAVYINADEEEVSSDFSIDYDLALYEIKASDLPAFMKKHNGTNKIAIYNQQEMLIFFGEKNNDLRTTRDIWNQFREADSFQEIWEAGNRTVICVLPKELVRPDKVQTEE